MSSPSVALVVVAAGRGARLGADRPKQYLPCAGLPLLAHTLEALLSARPYSAATVVIHPEDRALYERRALRPARGRPLGARAALHRGRDATGERPRGARGARPGEAGRRADP